MNFHLRWIGNNVLVTFKGKIDFTDIYKANTIIIGNSKFDNMVYQIFEFSNVEAFNITNEDILAISALDKSSSVWNKNIKGALVFKDKSVLKLAEKYIELMQNVGWEIKIFYNIDDAVNWCSE